MDDIRLHVKLASSLRGTCRSRIIHVERIVAIHAIAIVLMSLPDPSRLSHGTGRSPIGLPRTVVIRDGNEKLSSKIHSDMGRRSRYDTSRVYSRDQDQGDEWDSIK
jgi:hypothetical protein